MRIGVTGTFSGGKDLVGNYLASRGFDHVSTGDLVREEATKREIPWDRRPLQELANKLREEFGPGYLARLALTRFPDNVVISGLRNMGEVEDGHLALLISIDAPIEERYKRAKQRGKLTDDMDFETFVLQEQYEMGHEKTGQQLGEVMATADVSIWNSGTREEVYRQVDAALERFRK